MKMKKILNIALNYSLLAAGY